MPTLLITATASLAIATAAVPACASVHSNSHGTVPGPGDDALRPAAIAYSLSA